MSQVSDAAQSLPEWGKVSEPRSEARGVQGRSKASVKWRGKAAGGGSFSREAANHCVPLRCEMQAPASSPESERLFLASFLSPACTNTHIFLS